MNLNQYSTNHHLNPVSSMLISPYHQHQQPFVESSSRMDWEVSSPSPMTSSSSYRTKSTMAGIKNFKLEIHEIHLSYLTRDETMNKEKFRARLEILLNKYLTMVPHIQKFQFRKIRDCLELTVKKTTFDATKVISAFKAVESYATNLLNYPWRHEYQNIFAFNGFFHRFIKCSLVGYEELFELMGYHYDSSLDTYKLVEIPIDPDKLIQISFECLVAIVEIQIMQEIKTHSPEMTWKDILFVRSNYICDTQSAIEHFCDLKRNNKLIDLDIDLPDYSVKKFNHQLDFLSPVMNNVPNNIPNEIIIPPPPNYLESDLDTIDFVDSSPPVVQQQTKQNKMNFDDDRGSSSSQHLCENKKPISNRSRGSKKIIINKNKNIDPILMAQITSFEEQNGQNMNNKHSGTNYRNSFDNLESNKRKPSLNNYVEKESFNKPTNSNKITDKDSLKFMQSKSIENLNNSLSASSLSSSSSLMYNSNQNKKWSCEHCTFMNMETLEICDMCNRSRTKGNESTPLMTGGRECNKCTLVNDKNESFCKACHTSLADSSTYI